MKETPLFSSYEEDMGNIMQGYASCEPMVQGLLKKHAEQQCEDLFATYLVLAARCLPACSRPPASELMSALQEALWQTLQQSRYSLVRERMAAVLAGLVTRDETVRNRYLAFLCDKQQPKALRLLLVNALGEDSSVHFAEVLLSLLLGLSERNADMLLPLRDSLIRLRANALVPKLLDLVLQKQLDPRHRGALAGVVGKLGRSHPEVVTQLLTVLLDEEEEKTVRIFVASALGDLGDQSVVPVMLTLLQDIANSDDELDVVEEVEQLTLFPVADGREAREEESSTSRKSLKKRCPGILAVPLACALEHLLLPMQIPELLPFLYSWRVDLPARECLTYIIVTKATPEFLKGNVLPLVRDKSVSREIREILALTCGERPDAHILPALQQITGLAEQTVERALLVARYRLGDQTVAKLLKKVLGYKNFRSSSDEVQAALLRCFDLSSVLQLVTEPTADPFLRQFAIALLPSRSEQEYRTIVPHLLRVLRSSKELDMNREIIKTLGEIGRDLAELKALLSFFLRKKNDDLADEAHRALWAICSSMGKTIMGSERGYQLVQPKYLLDGACSEG